jgi:hypothetical protein
MQASFVDNPVGVVFEKQIRRGDVESLVCRFEAALMAARTLDPPWDVEKENGYEQRGDDPYEMIGISGDNQNGHRRAKSENKQNDGEYLRSF